MAVGAERHGADLALVGQSVRSIRLDRACHEPRLARTTRSRSGESAGTFSRARASQSIPSACLLPVQEVVSPFDAEAGQRALHLVGRSNLLAAVADVGQPGLDLLGQVQGRGMPVLGLRAPWPSGRSPRAPGRSPGRAAAARGRCRARTRSSTSETSPSGNGDVPDQQAIQGRAQAVDVAGRTDPLEHRPRACSGLMYRGVPTAAPGRVSEESWSPGAGTRCVGSISPRDRSAGLGDPPVDHQRLAEPAEHDVLGLDVAVDDPPAVRVGHGVAGGDQAAGAAAGRPARARVGSCLLRVRAMEPLDGGLERLPLDEPHRVVRPAVGIAAQPVDRHDPRMLEPARDLGLEHEPRLAVRVVRVVGLELLEGDLAVELAVERDEDLAQPAAGVRSQDLESALPRIAGCFAVPEPDRSASRGSCDRRTKLVPR